MVVYYYSKVFKGYIPIRTMAKKEIKVMQKKYPPSDFDVALHNLHQDMMNDFRVYPTNDLKIKQNKLMGEK